MGGGLPAKVDERATVVERHEAGSSTALADWSGQVIEGRYRLVRKAGAGSMGDVYEGRELTEDRRVAVKILKPEHAAREVFRQRFLREAKSAAMIAHPNVVDVHEVGHTAQGVPYYVMEYLEGEDLRALLDRERRISWAKARAILVQVAGALAAAHDKGVVHRDIKPSNLLVWFEGSGQTRRPVVKLLDFGVAKLRVDMVSRELTQAADVVGTVLYMSPEQAQGRAADARSDVYAFGIMAYELVTGQVPFRGDDIFDVMRQHLQVEPVPPRRLRPDLPASAETFVLRCLAKPPEARFQSMGEALRTLGHAETTRTPAARKQTLRVSAIPPTPAVPAPPAHRPADPTAARVDPIAATVAASPAEIGRAHLETVRASIPAPPAPNPMAPNTMPATLSSTMPMSAPPASGAIAVVPSSTTSEVAAVPRRSLLATVFGVAFIVIVVAPIVVGLVLIVLG